MSRLAGRSFVKMNGAGNSILVLDLRDADFDVSAQEAIAIGGAPGLRFDQMMVLKAPKDARARAFVKILNVDGSSSGACGNGSRCVAHVLMRDGGDRTTALETARGILACERLGEREYRVDMGAPRLRWDQIPLAEAFADTTGVELQIGPIDAPILHTPAVCNMGNPHAVFFVDDLDRYDLARIGPLLESHPLFLEKANISLARVEGPQDIRLRVWERGVGLTLACGSGACATAVSAARKGLTGRFARVHLPGGTLGIAWRQSDDHVLMSGPIEVEREGLLPAGIFERAA